MDKRWNQLGELLVNYSLKIKPGERVMIAMVEPETYPLMYAIYENAIKAGAYPQVQFLSEELNRLTLKHGTDEQIGWVPEVEMFGMEWADVYFGLRGAHNLDVFWDVPSEKLQNLRNAMGKVSTARWQKTRWMLLRCPMRHWRIKPVWMLRRSRICGSMPACWIGRKLARNGLVGLRC